MDCVVSKSVELNSTGFRVGCKYALLLLVFVSQACLFLPTQTLPFTVFFIPLSADRFCLDLDYELVQELLDTLLLAVGPTTFCSSSR